MKVTWKKKSNEIKPKLHSKLVSRHFEFVQKKINVRVCARLYRFISTSYADSDKCIN